MIDGVHLFEGVTDATMGHGEGWQFLQVGRYLERAGTTAALVDFHFNQGADAGGQPRRVARPAAVVRGPRGVLPLLHGRSPARRIVEFLLLNVEFPRSVRFAAARVESALRVIAQLTGRGAGGRTERLAGRLHASLDYGQVDEILDDPHTFLDGIGRYAAEIHTAIYQSYVMYPIESALPA